MRARDLTMRFAMFMVAAYWLDFAQVSAHPSGAQAQGPDGAAWSSDPWLLTAFGLGGFLYALGMRRLWLRSRRASRALVRRAALFAGGWLALGLALLSPLDMLGEQLFSAHMVQHELLLLVAAPLLVLARPGGALAWSLPASWRRAAGWGFRQPLRLWRAMRHIVAAWILYAAVLWAWHMPPMFRAALDFDAVHWLQHLSFLFAALVFWQSLIAVASRHGIAILSLFTTAAHCSLLGALLAFAPRAWYAPYFETTRAWGLTPLEDQQLGGLIMWMPGGAVYALAALLLLGRLLTRPRRSEWA